MTSETMPEPVAAVIDWVIRRSVKARLAEGTTLITTEQAEAYAVARVREALEEADQALETLYTEALNARVSDDEDDEAWNLTCLARAQSLSQAQLKIRALLPD